MTRNRGAPSLTRAALLRLTPYTSPAPLRPQVTTCDAQPSPSSGVMVFVSGNLIVRCALSPLRASPRTQRSAHPLMPRCFLCRATQTEGESRAIKFSQVFHLMPAGTSWFVFNDLFRLNYG